MTDLEITRLCAEAMGIIDTHFIDTDYDGDFQQWPCLPDDSEYDPLHDDAQAMALVKKFNLDIMRGENWHAVKQRYFEPKGEIFEGQSNDSLNRAICECVAKMQAAKK